MIRDGRLVAWISHGLLSAFARIDCCGCFTLDARGICSGESDYPVDLELINGLGLGSLGSGRTSR